LLAEIALVNALAEICCFNESDCTCYSFGCGCCCLVVNDGLKELLAEASWSKDCFSEQRLSLLELDTEEEDLLSTALSLSREISGGVFYLGGFLIR
jgi:hypothetical protein